MISPPCELAATSVGDVGCHLMLVTRLSNGLAVQYSLAVDNDLVYGSTKDFMTHTKKKYCKTSATCTNKT